MEEATVVSSPCSHEWINHSYYLDMIFEVTFDNRVGEELIFRSNFVPLIPCPLDILLPASIVVIAVDQAQYEPDPILAGLRHHKIQPLDQEKAMA